MVVGAGAVEGCVDDVLDAVEGVEDGFAFVEVCAGGRGLGEGEVHGGDGGEGEDVRVLGGRFVDAGGQGGEEG